MRDMYSLKYQEEIILRKWKWKKVENRLKQIVKMNKVQKIACSQDKHQAEK